MKFASWLSTWWLVPVLLLAWGGCGFYLGGQHSDARWQALQVAQERAARDALQAAQVRGDALSTELLVRTGEIDQLKEESHRAISKATTGRTCLDGAAVRVLQRAPGITTVPAPTSGAAAAGEPVASAGGDGGWGADSVSTDTQVATWAVDAASAFEVCRTRLDALIDWHATP